MRDNPEESELDSAEGVRRRCKMNSPSVSSCIGKRRREGYDRGSEVGAVLSASSYPFVLSAVNCLEFAATVTAFFCPLTYAG